MHSIIFIIMLCDFRENTIKYNTYIAATADGGTPPVTRKKHL